MEKKGTSRSNKNLNSEISLLQWAILIGTCLFLFIFPFQIALFNGFQLTFEGPLLESMIYAFILLVIVGIRYLRTWQLNDYRSILSITVMLLPIMYLISSINAASSYNAKIMLQLEFMYAAFFIIGLYIASSKLHQGIVELSIQISSYAIVIFGFMNLFGQTYFNNALWLADNGYRLTSVFQYSNSYAAFLVAIFLGALFSATHTKQWYWRAIHSFMLVPIWISLMLTYSRAALVFIPILVLIILPFMKIGKQLSFLIYMFLAIVSSFAILSKITVAADKISKLLDPASQSGKTLSLWNSIPLEGWGLLLGVSVVLMLLISFFHHKLSHLLETSTIKFGQTKWSFFAVPILFIIVGALAAVLVFSSSGIRGVLPQSIADRIESINLEQHSVLERETFYRDALKISADYPLTGAGGGAWSALYEKYQNNPYSSNQEHSFFFQTLIEIGWIGVVILFGFIIWVYYLFIKAYIRNPELRGTNLLFFIISLSILAHSIVDFDMSYGYLSVLVFLCLGCMLAPLHKELLIPAFENYKDMKWRIIYPISISLLAIVLFTMVYREYDANLSYQRALTMAIEEKKPLNELLPTIDHAISIAPDNPEYTLRKMNWMDQAFNSSQDPAYRQEFKRLMDQLKPFAPYNRSLLLEEYKYYKNVGDSAKVLQVLDEAISKSPWDMNFYEAGIMEYFIAGQQQGATDSEDSNINWNHSLDLYKEVLDHIEHLKSLPAGQLQGHDFTVTPLIRQAIGQIFYRNKSYEDAYNLLKEDIAGDLSNETVRINVRFYLASLHAIGQNDEELLNKLIESDENEKTAVQQLIDSQ
ncbi:O-antigen ligase family protein [Paenibacillus sepulcri]|uniref:O-antigen ligase family protein n=1 Tax=Paenibacillus sepulcri TaxID=359917 RepID=A0ABS7BVN9_9BACL|nr:O-antigen ligase family protein [Paenibacillus sepulcri]